MKNCGKLWKKGFTLIELMVVISIIALLSSIILSSLKSAKDKANIISAVQSFQELQKATELYYSNYGAYPGVGGPPQHTFAMGATGFTDSLTPFIQTWFINKQLLGGMPFFDFNPGPVNPTVSDWVYFRVGNNSGAIASSFGYASTSAVFCGGIQVNNYAIQWDPRLSIPAGTNVPMPIAQYMNQNDPTLYKIGPAGVTEYCIAG